MTTNPFEDESRWTILSSRFETPALIRQMMDEMFEEWIESLPADHPARILHYMLPKPPRRGSPATEDEIADTVKIMGMAIDSLRDDLT